MTQNYYLLPTGASHNLLLSFRLEKTWFQYKKVRFEARYELLAAIWHDYRFMFILYLKKDIRSSSINQSIKFYLYSPYSQTTVRLIGLLKILGLFSASESNEVCFFLLIVSVETHSDKFLTLCKPAWSSLIFKVHIISPCYIVRFTVCYVHYH